MKRSTTFFAAAAAALAVAALAAGCGGSSGTYGASSKGSASKAATGVATIGVRDSSLGPILVDARGRTVYLFEKDTGTASTCYGACASIWPPVTTSGAPTAGNGAVAAELGTTKRSDGTLQVTYNGHPLYTYVSDTNAGQTNGEGLDQFGAEWYVLSSAGQAVENGSS